jgi:hypothetical protein
MKELKHLQQVQSSLSKTNLVLISTDGIDNQLEVQQVLSDFNLQSMDNWIFADDMPERLRYYIDPNWFGELPRAYFYDASHQRSSKSGALNLASLQEWIRKIQTQNNASPSH